MGDKETFASELDRLLLPYIEWLDANQRLLVDEKSRYGDEESPEFSRYFCSEGDLMVEWLGESAQGATPLQGYRVEWKGQLVYHRDDGGFTRVLRPGTWIMELVSFSLASQTKDAMEEMQAAVNRALAKVPAFAPI